MVEELRFVAESHQYFVGDVELGSVSNFYGAFFKKFDTEGVAPWKAKAICKEVAGKPLFSVNGMPQLVKLFLGDAKRAKEYWKLNRAKPQYAFIKADKVIEMWDEKRDTAAAHGTEVHDTLEHHILGEDYPHTLVDNRSPSKIEHGLSYIEKEMSGKITPELRIYAKDWRLAGTIDLYEELPNGDIILSDWKTNEAIEFSGYNGEKGLGVLSHLDSCNFIKYSLQLNIYKAILENFYGKNVVGLYIVHLTEDGYQKIEAVDLQAEVKEMLAEHLSSEEEGEEVEGEF